MKIIRELLAEATEPCNSCDGTGWYGSPITPAQVLRCFSCHGTGRQLTPEGSELVGFAAHWLKPHFAGEDHFHGADHEHDV
jgi:DnaJ-class molecular chaperone